MALCEGIYQWCPVHSPRKGPVMQETSQCHDVVMAEQLKYWFAALTWWRHQMETFSTLLAICPGNSPVTGEFPAQRPVMRSFDVFFDLRLNKRLSKQSWGWWFETLSCPLWRHCNEPSVIWTPVQQPTTKFTVLPFIVYSKAWIIDYSLWTVDSHTVLEQCEIDGLKKHSVNICGNQ